jgi:preprotein translocase subunit SecG
MLNFSFYLTMVIAMVVCVFLILLVLIQKGRGGGLTGAFGGAGANTAFGSKTGDVLTWATSVVFGIFLILFIGLNLMADRMARGVPRGTTPAVVTPPVTPATQPAGQAEPMTGVPTERAQPGTGTTAAPATQSAETQPQ